MLLRSAGGALLESPATSRFAVNTLAFLYGRFITKVAQKSQSIHASERNSKHIVLRGVRRGRLEKTHKDRSRGIAPNGKTLLAPYDLSKRVKALCDKKEYKEAIARVKEAPRDAQNVKVWNTLIHEVMEVGKYKEGYRLFTDMKRRGFDPTTRTYSTMLGAFSKIEHWQKHPLQLENVFNLYDQLTRHYEGVKSKDPDSTELSTIPFTQLIKIFGRAQQFQRMYDAFNSMPSEGPLAPTVHTYTALLNSIGHRRTSSLVSSVSKAHEGGKEGEPSYHELMYKNSSDAKLIWRQLINASAKSPELAVDSHALQALLKILCRGRPSDQNFAFDIVYEYFGLAKPGQSSIPPKVELHPLTLESLLMACNNANRYNLTLHYVQQIIDSDSGVGPGEHPLGLRRILNTRHMDIVLETHAARAALGSSDESEEALDILEWMLRMQAVPPSPGKEGGIGWQIRPTTSTYDLVVLICSRCPDWERACRVFELMTGYDAAHFRGDMRDPPRQERRSEGRNLIPTPNFMTSLIRTASKTKQSAYAKQALNIFEHYGWDTFFAVDKPGIGSSFAEQKGSLLLARTLAEVLPSILKSSNWDEETKRRWSRLQERVKLKMKASRREGAGTYTFGRTSAVPSTQKDQLYWETRDRNGYKPRSEDSL